MGRLGQNWAATQMHVDERRTRWLSGLVGVVRPLGNQIPE